MLMRTILILALLTQQLAVWPCLSLCRMLGDCTGASTCSPSTDCMTACETASDAACESVCEMACTQPGDCDCGPLGYLACASSTAEPLNNAPPAPPAPPHFDFLQMLGLPSAIIAIDLCPAPELVGLTQAETIRRGSASACPLRAALCCWLI